MAPWTPTVGLHRRRRRRRRPERGARARPRPAAHARGRRRPPEQPRRPRHRRSARPRRHARRPSSTPPVAPSSRRYPTVEVRTGEVVGGRARRRRLRARRSPTAAASWRAGCCSRRGWTTASPTCPASPSAGAGRCSTARSATAGRCATGRSACSTAARPACDRALLLRAWSDDVTLLHERARRARRRRRRPPAGGRASPSTSGRSTGLRGPGDELTAVVFADGDERPCGGLLVPVTLHQRSALARSSAPTSPSPGMVAADALAVDATFHTSVPGLSAAGDVSTQMPSVAAAIADGIAGRRHDRARPDGGGLRARAGVTVRPTGRTSTGRAGPDGAATPTPCWSPRSTGSRRAPRSTSAAARVTTRSGWRPGAGG